MYVKQQQTNTNSYYCYFFDAKMQKRDFLKNQAI